MKKLLLSLALNFFTLHALSIPTEVQQLLVVMVDDSKQNKALLYAYERESNSSNQSWNYVFSAIPVTLGRQGIALGMGLHQLPFMQKDTLDNKIEGDGKSPAGLFKLSTVFGYQSQNPNPKMPYLHLNQDLHCVDDSQSKYYNQIISKRSGYKSFEQMRRNDNLYEFGIVVEHNKEALASRGSCIFIHIMNRKKEATAGCTAMSRKNLLKIIAWLDQKKNPAFLLYLNP